MDAVLRNFKNIPCPAGDKCSQANCQWKHERDTKTTTTADDDSGSADQLGPRKRIKVQQPSSTTPSTKGSHKIPAASKTVVNSAEKSVSPPPLKRKTPSVTHDTATPSAKKSRPSTPPSKATIHSPSPAITSTPRSAGSTPATSPAQPPVKRAPAARKPEALNPRHLKSSPATHGFRFQALTMLHAQFARLNGELKKDASKDEESLVLSDQELVWLSLDQEERLATDKPPIYSNLIKNKIMTYKRMSVAKWKEEREDARKKELAAVAPKTPDKPPALGPPVIVHTGLTHKEEVKFLSRILTPIDDLSQYGYVPSPPAEAAVNEARAAAEVSKGWEVCDRCTTRFQVFPGRREEDGVLASGGKCTHHPGKTYFPEKQPGERGRSQKRWRCCKEAVGDTPGCTKGETHVFKITHPNRLSAVLPYAQTPANPHVPTDRAVCFDCEMGYTVMGLELIRLTATSWPGGEELLDVLVRPVGEILDLNSRYSGVWPEDILNAEPYSPTSTKEGTNGDHSQQPAKESQEEGEIDDDDKKAKQKKKTMKIVSSPAVARDLLFSFLAPSTPLIGHGLENDLNASRIVHPTLIDTVLLYPHRAGLPVRNGLKALMASKLNRSIQVEAADGQKPLGHDSGEDARAAGELVRLKVRDEWAMLKGIGWTLVNGEFVPPEAEKSGGKLTEEFLERSAGDGKGAAPGFW